jgi:hypothetical protein
VLHARVTMAEPIAVPAPFREGASG